MPKLTVMTSKELIRLLKLFGFEVDHVTGSHYVLYNQGSKKRAMVPYHKKELPKGTLLSIIKSVGLTKEDLIVKL